MEEVKTARIGYRMDTIYSMWLRQVIRFFSQTSRVVTTFVYRSCFKSDGDPIWVGFFAGRLRASQAYQQMFQGLDFLLFWFRNDGDSLFFLEPWVG
jgi:hypothetical protein